MSEHVRRLAICAAVGAALWAYGLAMDTVVRPATLGATIRPVNVVSEMIAIAISGLMFLYVRYSSKSASTKTDVGLVYLVLNAMCVSALNTWIPAPAADKLSWNAIVILIGSMIIPTTPRKMLSTALVIASMDPLGIWAAHLRGLTVPAVASTFVLFMPNYACAVVAMLPSSVLQRLGRQLRHAQELGSYHLVELLGRGGMGEVWLGRHRLLARTAAIKLVRPELLGASTDAETQTMLRRFEREAQATAALSSPHTIRVFDFGVTAERTFYYVMELLSGRDLESLVRQFGPMPADRVLFLLRQVCHSLAEAHARGLVHRDITPANIYVCRMGLDYDFVKVLDFGLVTFRDRHTDERTSVTTLATTHTTTGTPAFMAPEITLEGHVDQRADVYGIGCVAYYLLTGQLVFEADNAIKMFVQHLQAPPIPPSERSQLAIPSELEAIVLACLEKDPAKRPHNADDLLRMLDACRLPGTWNSDAAKPWWEHHLVEFTGALAA